MYREYSIHFFPNISASTAHLELRSEKYSAQARRLSTPSYVEGEWEDNSFKTQWRWSFEEVWGTFNDFETVCKAH